MAEADLDELGVDHNELTDQFNKAANHLKSYTSNLDTNMLLALYGYYKQATEGPCNVPKPSWYDTKAKAKWNAWNKLNDLDAEEAKVNYIQLVQTIDSDFNPSVSTTEPSWVSVSTLQGDNEPVLNHADKSLTDFVKEGNLKEVVTLLQSYNHKELQKLINQVDGNGLSLLHWAADRGSSDILDTIISFGADVNLLDVDSQTALHYAVSCGHVDCVLVLLKNGADVSLKDSEGLDAKAVASDESVRELLDNYS